MSRNIKKFLNKNKKLFNNKNITYSTNENFNVYFNNDYDIDDISKFNMKYETEDETTQARYYTGEMELDGYTINNGLVCQHLQYVKNNDLKLGQVVLGINVPFEDKGEGKTRRLIYYKALADTNYCLCFFVTSKKDDNKNYNKSIYDNYVSILGDGADLILQGFEKESYINPTKLIVMPLDRIHPFYRYCYLSNSSKISLMGSFGETSYVRITDWNEQNIQDDDINKKKKIVYGTTYSSSIRDSLKYPIVENIKDGDCVIKYYTNNKNVELDNCTGVLETANGNDKEIIRILESNKKNSSQSQENKVKNFFDNRYKDEFNNNLNEKEKYENKNIIFIMDNTDPNYKRYQKCFSFVNRLIRKGYVLSQLIDNFDIFLNEVY